MIKSEEEIKDDWMKLDVENVQKICNMVREYDRGIQDYLADIVASVCDITTEELFSQDGTIHSVHARWLFWYAYRYATNDTFIHLARITRRYGCKFSTTAINSAVNNMSSLIISNTIWTKRWTVVKRIIKARDQVAEFDFGLKQNFPSDKITINIPKEFRNKIEINYGE